LIDGIKQKKFAISSKYVYIYKVCNGEIQNDFKMITETDYGSTVISFAFVVINQGTPKVQRTVRGVNAKGVLNKYVSNSNNNPIYYIHRCIDIQTYTPPMYYNACFSPT